MIKLIAATDKNNGIGVNGDLPWRIREALLHFSKTTIGSGNNAVIMGRNTWESIGSVPLHNRVNVIVSKVICYPYSSIVNSYKDNTIFFNQIEEAVKYCKTLNVDDIFIIGGQQIYEYFLNTHDENIRPDSCIISRINKEYVCDTYFPDLSKNGYFVCNNKQLLPTKDNSIDIMIETWDYIGNNETQVETVETI